MTLRRSKRLQDVSQNYGEETDNDTGDGQPLGVFSAAEVTGPSTPDVTSDCETMGLSKANLSATTEHRWARKFYFSHVILGLMLALLAQLILFGQDYTPPVVEIIHLDAITINFTRRVHNIPASLALVANKTSSLPTDLNTFISPFGTTRLGVVEIIRQLSFSTSNDIKDAINGSQRLNMNAISWKNVHDANRLVDRHAETAKRAWDVEATELPTLWLGATLTPLSYLQHSLDTIVVAPKDPFFHRVNMTQSHYSHRLPAKPTVAMKRVLKLYSQHYRANHWMGGSCAFLSRCSGLKHDDHLHPACYVLRTESTFDLQQHFERFARRTLTKPEFEYSAFLPNRPPASIVFELARHLVGLSMSAMQMVTLSKQASLNVTEEVGWIKKTMPHMLATSPKHKTAAQSLSDTVLGVLSEQIKAIMEVLFDIRDACGELDNIQTFILGLSNPDSWIQFNSGTKTVKQMKHPLDQSSLLQNEGRLIQLQVNQVFHRTHLGRMG